MIVAYTVTIFSFIVQLNANNFIVERGTIFKLLFMTSRAFDETLSKLRLVVVVEELKLVGKPHLVDHSEAFALRLLHSLKFVFLKRLNRATTTASCGKFGRSSAVTVLNNRVIVF